MNRIRVTVALAGLIGLASSVSAQSPAAPTFSKDVAPILYKNCTNCHRAGEIGPMQLVSFSDARPWAKAIATRVTDGTMPPWHADPAHGQFANDRRLSDKDRDTIEWTLARRAISEGKPIMGICLGHQILALDRAFDGRRLRPAHGASLPGSLRFDGAFRDRPRRATGFVGRGGYRQILAHGAGIARGAEAAPSNPRRCLIQASQRRSSRSYRTRDRM
jgi:hypothetical protein